MIFQCFETKLKSLSDRLDVIFYSIKKDVEIRLNIGLSLDKLVKPIKTKTPPQKFYIDEGTPCLKLRNVTGRILNITNCDFIYPGITKNYIIAKKFDIILTATGQGTAGRTDLFLESGRYVVTGENILLRPNLEMINPFYLLAMLRTEIISQQLTHFVRGATGQTHLYWKDISKIRIPIAEKDTQLECERLFNDAWNFRRMTIDRVNETKKIVKNAANLTDLDVQRRNITFETKFSRLQSPIRFDVEYYQPIHDLIERKLKNGDAIELSAVAKINKKTVNPRKTPTNTYRYIDISSIDIDSGDYDTSRLFGYECPVRARKKPQKGDLIVSTVRPNRNAIAIIDNNCDDIVVSTGFAIITPIKIDPYILFAILKTKEINIQIGKKATAAMYPAVTEEDILSILIPKLSKDDETQLRQLIIESKQLRKNTDDLLSDFKNIGEAVIKQNTKLINC